MRAFARKCEPEPEPEAVKALLALLGALVALGAHGSSESAESWRFLPKTVYFGSGTAAL